MEWEIGGKRGEIGGERDGKIGIGSWKGKRYGIGRGGI